MFRLEYFKSYAISAAIVDGLESHPVAVDIYRNAQASFGYLFHIKKK